MNSSVTMTTHKVRSPSGKRYVYHQLRWFGPDGTRYSENIGRTDKVSKRQAEKLRQAKEMHLRATPGLSTTAQSHWASMCVTSACITTYDSWERCRKRHGGRLRVWAVSACQS